MKKLLFVIYLLIIPHIIFSQEQNMDINHFIISVDKSGFHVERFDNVLDQIKQILNDMHVKGDDYLSMACYAALDNQSSCADYVKPITYQNEDISFISYKNSSIDTLWKILENVKIGYGNPFSINSFAKQLSLLEFRNDDKQINNTYVIMVSDGVYNGGDFYNECKKSQDAGLPSIVVDELKEQYSIVEQHYNYKLEQSIILAPKCIIELYRFIPKQEFFCIESILEYPKEILAKRVKGGYVIKCNTEIKENESYTLLKNTFNLNIKPELKKNNIDFFLSDNEIINNDEIIISMKSDVKFFDESVGSVILYSEGNEQQGSKGLNRTIKVTLEQDAKICGVLPLTDELFSLVLWTDDQNIAATHLSLIILIIFLIIITITIRIKSRDYSPISTLQ